jgi:hypothetical protein
MRYTLARTGSDEWSRWASKYDVKFSAGAALVSTLNGYKIGAFLEWQLRDGVLRW